MIGHTQPRRLAATSVAKRIAEELNTPMGEVVGYQVRFNDRTGPNAAIKLMTDGILLAESQRDPLLRRYDTIIIDEAHERSLNIDFLLGYLKQLLPRRPDLKVIITSATIDAERFARHFGAAEDKPAPVIEVSGRLYPVELRYRPVRQELAEDEDAPAPARSGRERDRERMSGDEERDLIDAIVDAVDECARHGPGDVLVFLPGEREIRESAEALRKHHPVGTEVLPLYARLSQAEQEQIFHPRGNARRVVLATNVAETSLTVPGIRYVVDSGLARVKRYSWRNKVEQLRIEPVSRASANQRRPLRPGRAGRLHPPVRRAGFQRARALYRSRSAALVVGLGDPADEGAEAGRHRTVSLRRGAAGTRGGRRLSPAAGAGRDRAVGRRRWRRGCLGRVFTLTRSGQLASCRWTRALAA